MTATGQIASPISLEITDPAGTVSRLEVTADRSIIGRNQQADIMLASNHVSRRHAELSRDPFGRWWIRDLGSQNGTLINGRVIKEQVLRPADVLSIGDFTLRVTLPGVREHTTTTTTHITVTSDPMGRISTLRDHDAPRIARHHLTKLMQLYHHLQQVADIDERYRMLASAMVSPEFQGQWAAIIRLDTTTAEPEPELLCEPQFGPACDQAAPISRSLLRAIQSRREAVMASQNAQGDADIALSMMPTAHSMAAVACPLELDASRIDLLYIMLPAHYATGEWLALANLASEEFRHAEAAHRARAQGEAHAALERELESARHIQMSLVPKRIDCPGLDVGIGFKPCRWVGGDYVDVICLTDDTLFVAVADVCGKGLPAALLASRIHTGVHSNLAADMKLPQLMTNLNNYLCKTLPPGSFVTMIALTIRVSTGEIEFVNAGHPPPIVVKAGATRCFTQGENPPLGIQPGPLAPQRDLLHAGEILALYTDGLSELTGESGEMLGIEGLERELATLCTPTAAPDKTAQALSDRLTTLLGDQLPQDDQTFLLLRRH